MHDSFLRKLFIWPSGLLVLLSFFSSCEVLVDDLHDVDCGHGFFSNSQMECLTWPKNLTIPYSFDQSVIDNFSSEQQEEIHKAFGLYRDTLDRPRFEFTGVIHGNGSGDSMNTIYIVKENYERGSTSQAFTRVLSAGIQITEADITLNAESFSFSIFAESNKIHIQSLLIHEVGHVLGLVHNDKDPLSVMDRSLRFGEVRTMFSASDLENLSFAYTLLNK